MKKIALLIAVLGVGATGICQKNELNSFERERISITRHGMTVLGGWATANIISGAIGSGTKNREAHYFHQMNMFWGGTNLLLAGLGYWGASKEKTDDATVSSVLLHQNKIEKTFLFNGGLDIAYVATGFYLKERSRRNTDPSKLAGYGNSVLLQGGGLLLFDGVMYFLHQRHGKKLAAITDKLVVSSGPVGVLVTYQL